MAGYKFALYIIIGNECGTYLLLHKVLRLVFSTGENVVVI